MRRITAVKRLAVILAAIFVTAGLVMATAPSALADTLINTPVARVCHYHRFTVGVWAQPGTSWANRRYVVKVYNPNHVRVLYKRGHAPTSHWLFWHPKAWLLGKYRTYYKTWHNGTVIHSGPYVTRSVRC
jgi:hypothetical protein